MTTVAYGIQVDGGSPSTRIEGNTSYANNVGIYGFGTGVVIGNADLSLDRGNLVFGNRATGIRPAGRRRSRATWCATRPTRTRPVSISSAARARCSTSFRATLTGISGGSGGTFRGNRVFNNTGTGINAAVNTVVENVVYSNAIGMRIGRAMSPPRTTWCTTTPTSASSPPAASNRSSTTRSTRRPAMRSASSRTPPTRSCAATSCGRIPASALSVAADSQNGFSSDYNVFYAPAGKVGNWQGADRVSLTTWRNATFGDANSLFINPLFVDADGADNVLGYVSAAADGRDDDFHLQSLYGSFKGGALAPVSGATGTPFFLTPVLSSDAAQSPAIDRGAPGAPTKELAENGGFINVGAYGNTAQASKSPAQYVLVTNPNGSEAIPQESNFDIRWRANGFPGNVAIEIASVATPGVWQTLSANEANDGSYVWAVPNTLAIGDYLIRVRSIDVPAIADVSDAAFSVTPPISFFYVNDGSLGGDEYTTAIGNDANDGLTAATPKASLRAILEAYDLDAGDVVFVDTGVYNLTTNIPITVQDSGVAHPGSDGECQSGAVQPRQHGEHELRLRTAGRRRRHHRQRGGHRRVHRGLLRGQPGHRPVHAEQQRGVRQRKLGRGLGTRQSRRPVHRQRDLPERVAVFIPTDPGRRSSATTSGATPATASGRRTRPRVQRGSRSPTTLSTTTPRTASSRITPSRRRATSPMATTWACTPTTTRTSPKATPSTATTPA